MTRVLFYSAGTTGSGHIVRGLAVAAAFRRLGIQHEYAILSSDIPYTRLATRLGVRVSIFPDEGEEALRRGRYLDSSVFKAITAYSPDILIVEQFWHGLDAFIRELPCRKVLLTFQMDPAVFHLQIRENEYVLRPTDYDLLLRTEPGYEVPFAARVTTPSGKHAGCVRMPTSSASPAVSKIRREGSRNSPTTSSIRTAPTSS